MSASIAPSASFWVTVSLNRLATTAMRRPLPARWPQRGRRGALAMRNRVAHERVGQDHFGIATLGLVAGRQQRGVEAEA